MLNAFLHGFQSRPLTRTRVWSAFAIALTTDALQVLLGPLGWAFADEILDGLATILIGLLIGFHPILLPTFILELVPVAEMLPTWTACVAIVVALRRRQHGSVLPPGAAA